MLLEFLSTALSSFECRGWVGKNECYQLRVLVPADRVIPREESVEALNFYDGNHQSYSGDIAVSCGKKFSQGPSFMDSEDALSHMSKSKSDRLSAENGQNATGFYIGEKYECKYVYLDLLDLKPSRTVILKVAETVVAPIVETKKDYIYGLFLEYAMGTECQPSFYNRNSFDRGGLLLSTADASTNRAEYLACCQRTHQIVDLLKKKKIKTMDMVLIKLEKTSESVAILESAIRDSENQLNQLFKKSRKFKELAESNHA